MKLRIGALLLLGIAALSTIGPFLPGVDPFTQDLSSILAPPSAEHPLGTDGTGRDVLSRVIIGGQHALVVSLISAALATTLGVVLGVAAAWSKRLDHVLSRLADVQLSIPVIVIAIVVLAFLPKSGWPLIAVLVLGSWVLTFRLIRTNAQQILTQVFIEVAASMGAKTLFVIRRHLLPHLAATIAIAASINAAGIFGAVSTLGFLGLGVSPPTPDWGSMVSSGQALLAVAPLQSLAPGLLIVATLVGIQLAGDGVADVFNKTTDAAAQRTAISLRGTS